MSTAVENPPVREGTRLTPAERAQLKRDEAWLDEHWQEIERDYVGRWIAIFEERVRGANPDYLALHSELNAQGLSSRQGLCVLVEERVPRMGF